MCVSSFFAFSLSSRRVHVTHLGVDVPIIPENIGATVS